MDSADSLKKIAKSAFIVLFGLVISKLLTYVYRIIIARIGTEEYGLISLGFAIIGILGIFSLIGFEDGLLRYLALYKAKNKNKVISEIFNFSLKLSLVLSVIFSVILFYYSIEISILFFHNEKFIPILKIFSLSLPFYIIYKICLAALRGLQNIKAWSYIGNIGESGIKLILTALLLYFGLGIMGAAIAYVLTFLALTFISYYYLKKTFPISKTKFKHHKEFFGYSWPLMFSGIFVTIILWTDSLLLGYFRNASEVGIYNAASPTSMLPNVIPSALLSLFVPILTELSSLKKKGEFKDVYRTTTRWSFLIGIPLFIILILFSKQILGILFGIEYEAGYIALIILTIGYLIYFMFETSSKMLNIMNKSKLVFINLLIATIVNIILNVLLIPILGLNGAAIATASSLVISNFLAWIEAYSLTKIQPIKINYKILSAALITIILFFIVNKFIVINSLIKVGMASILIVLFYALLIFVFRALSKEDKYILNLVYEKLKRTVKS